MESIENYEIRQNIIEINTNHKVKPSFEKHLGIILYLNIYLDQKT